MTIWSDKYIIVIDINLAIAHSVIYQFQYYRGRTNIMKKLLSIFVLITIIAAMFAVSTSASTEPMKVIYLNGSHANASDDNSGQSTEDPVLTLWMAFTRLGDEGGIICVSGDTAVDDFTQFNSQDSRPDVKAYQLDMPAHTGKVYITSINDAKLKRTWEMGGGTAITFNGPVEIYNVTFENTVVDVAFNIYCMGNEITMGNGVQVIAGEGFSNIGLTIYGFSANSDESGLEGNPVINVYSGSYMSLYAGGTAGAGTLYGNTTINFYGGYSKNVQTGSKGSIIGTTLTNIYPDAVVDKIYSADPSSPDEKFHGATVYLYGGVEPTTGSITDTVTVNRAAVVPPVMMPDSDMIIFEVNNIPPTDWAPETDPLPEETNPETDPIEDTKPIESEQTPPEESDPITPEETDPITPEETDPVQTPGTEAPGTEKPVESGCGGTVSSALALVAITSLGALAFTKKKRM